MFLGFFVGLEPSVRGHAPLLLSGPASDRRYGDMFWESTAPRGDRGGSFWQGPQRRILPKEWENLHRSCQNVERLTVFVR